MHGVIFSYNMFLRPEKNEKFEIEWTVISAPNFYANPKEDGVDNENFSIINFLKENYHNWWNRVHR